MYCCFQCLQQQDLTAVRWFQYTYTTELYKTNAQLVSKKHRSLKIAIEVGLTTYRLTYHQLLWYYLYNVQNLNENTDCGFPQSHQVTDAIVPFVKPGPLGWVATDGATHPIAFWLDKRASISPSCYAFDVWLTLCYTHNYVNYNIYFIFNNMLLLHL